MTLSSYPIHNHVAHIATKKLPIPASHKLHGTCQAQNPHSITLFYSILLVHKQAFVFVFLPLLVLLENRVSDTHSS